MKVLITFADRHSPNLGVRALATGSEMLVRSKVGASAEISMQDFAGVETGVRIRGKDVVRDATRRNGQITDLLRRFDLIWDTGAGDSFTDIYGAGRLARILYVQRTARRLGVPYIMGPQTIGPFSNSIARRAAVSSMRRMAAVGARDTTSHDFARSLGLKNTYLATDVAFALPVVPKAQSDVVYLNVSGLLWNDSSHLPSERYRKTVRRLLRGLLDRGHEVKLFAHVLDNSSQDNDVPVVEALADEFDLESLVPNSLEDAREHIARSGLVIGSRMHACLNALSLGVPTVPLAYSRKFAPLLSDLGWGHVVDLRSDIEPVDSVLTHIADLQSLTARAESVAEHARDRLKQAIEGISLPFADG